MHKWIMLLGNAAISGNAVTYTGTKTQGEGGQPIFGIALAMSNASFGGGCISAEVTFQTLEDLQNSNVAIVLYRNPATEDLILVQMGGLDFVSVWLFAGGNQANQSPGKLQWTRVGGTGVASSIEVGRTYAIEVYVEGSKVQVVIDGVTAIEVTLGRALPRGNPGLLIRGPSNVEVKNFSVSAATPKVFVVMQFSAPYNELYEDVIKPICKELGLEPKRADETFGPGIILADIERQILEARIVIADIGPRNMNVYYEVGFAHALKKETILIAEKPSELPFDVSSFRVFFYENTIAGKKKIEEGLRKHLEAITGTH